jgi:hypothetical protein
MASGLARRVCGAYGSGTSTGGARAGMLATRAQRLFVLSRAAGAPGSGGSSAAWTTARASLWNVGRTSARQTGSTRGVAPDWSRARRRSALVVACAAALIVNGGGGKEWREVESVSGFRAGKVPPRNAWENAPLSFTTISLVASHARKRIMDVPRTADHGFNVSVRLSQCFSALHLTNLGVKPTLPLDLVIEILSYLGSGSYKDRWHLRKCALVCRAWRIPAQRRIYSEMTLTGLEQPSLVRVLKEASHLLGYVRRLHFSRSEQPAVDMMGYDDQDEGEEECTVPARLLPVVRAMDQVTSINIDRIDFGNPKWCPEYARTLTSLASHFKEELALPGSVREVQLTYPHPVAILACFVAFPGLQVLNLGAMSSQDGGDWAIDVTDTHDAVLKQLKLCLGHAVYAFLAMLQSYPRAVAQLQILDIMLPVLSLALHDDMRVIASILALCGRALERLHVRRNLQYYNNIRTGAYSPLLRAGWGLTMQPNAAPFNFSSLYRLRILVVHANTFRELSFIRSILEAMGHSPSRDTVEEIQIQLRRGLAGPDDCDALGESDDWERVDAAIAGLATGRRFRLVSFLVRCTDFYLTEVASSPVKARLLLSQAAGAVEFGFTGCRAAPDNGQGRSRWFEVIKSPRASLSTHVWL